MTGHGFHSAFAAQLDAYLEFKAAMGFYGASRIWYLHKFDEFCARGDRTCFDQATVEEWVSDQLTRSGEFRSWMSYIRDFGRWLHMHGDPDAYVLSPAWKAQFVPAHPYLLTEEHIDRFFSAAAAITTTSPWRWQAVAFFTLMHSCGMRTGEVRHLAPTHVDLRDGYLDVVGAKGNRSRRLPLTGQVIAILDACDTAATGQFGPARGSFFVSSTGRPLTGVPVGVMFNRIWDLAGLPRPEGGQRPRPYDFRHHFAYANIDRWMADGVDVAAMLPYLARYMGHASVDSTYYYIQTSPRFLDDYAHLTETTTSVLPEVGFR